MMPSLYKLLSLKVFGNNLSITRDIHIPKDKNIKHSKILTKLLYVSLKNDILSGIKSNNDKKSITEEAKEIPPIKKLRLFFFDKNITNEPIKVEKPAKVEKINAILVFI